MPLPKSSKSKKKVSTQEQNTFTELIAGNFEVGLKIGEGSFGQVRLGKNISTGQVVAIKFEKKSEGQLAAEYQFYQLLKREKGFPTIYHFGEYEDWVVLVMDMLGRNLEALFEHCGRKFTLKTMIFITLQLLKRFESVHSVGVVYRDVKPENFCMGQNTNTIYIIDFGLSKHYLDPLTRRHIDYRANTHELIGTSRYMSVNAHLRRELSRRDDLEALGNVFLYFLRGKLPWSGIKAANSVEHNKAICEMKKSTPDEDLCVGHPDEYVIYLKYVKALQFDETPNYNKLRNMFKRMFRQNSFKDDGIFDWNR